MNRVHEKIWDIKRLLKNNKVQVKIIAEIPTVKIKLTFSEFNFMREIPYGEFIAVPAETIARQCKMDFNDLLIRNIWGVTS